MANFKGTNKADNYLGTLLADIMTGLNGNDTLDGNDGDDKIDGGSGNDWLIGGFGLDTLIGGSGMDTLDGGADNDLLDGGSNEDVLSGGEGNDTLDGGSSSDTLNGGNGNDSLIGGSASDVVNGDAGNDTLDGGSAGDTLDGGADNDLLLGGSANDSLLGGEGDDTLDGGTADDSLDGGNGIDQFNIDANSGNDSIYNLVPGDDEIVFSGLDPADLTLSTEEVDGVTNTVLTFADGPVVTVVDFDYTGKTNVFTQDFELGDAGWLDGGVYGDVTRVASGTDGIDSADGDWHAIATQSDYGSYTQFDGYRNTFPGEYWASQDIYLDTDWALGEGFGYSVASNGSDGAHQRDFIFHVTKDTSSGQLLVGASNNTDFAPNENLESGDHAIISDSGWFTFEHHFYDNGGVLAVDLNVYDAAHNLVFTDTLSDASDLIPAEVGGNRYGWFTNIDVDGGVAIDNTELAIDGPDVTGWYSFV